MVEKPGDTRPRGFPISGGRNLFLEAEGPFFVLDADGVIRNANLKACEAMGCGEEDLLGESWFDAVLGPGEERECLRAAFSGVVAGDADPPCPMEVPVASRGGDGRIISWSSFFLTDGGGRIASILCRGEDVTDRKRAEESLKKREERFRQVFMQADDVYMIMDRETLRVLEINPAVLAFGFTPEEILEGGVGLLLEKSGLQKLREALSSQKDRDVISIDRLPFMSRAGDPVAVSFRGQNIRLPESEVILGSFRDITDRILTEEEAKLMQAKLIQGNKMTSLGLMVSSVAHDINNPNNYILFNSRIVSDFLQDALPVLESHCRENAGAVVGGFSPEEFNDIIPKLMEGISDGTKMITRIVNDLKDFVRQNQQIMDWDIDVNHVVKGARSLIENHIKKYTEKFSVELSEDLPRIRGNKQQLIQVLVNIILNALESLPDKKHGVRVATSAEEQGKVVQIVVADEGSGMSEEVRERALEPFFSTRLDKGGTGLGLTICNSIIREHEGRMMIESRQGEGTVITLRLPSEKTIRRGMP